MVVGREVDFYTTKGEGTHPFFGNASTLTLTPATSSSSTSKEMLIHWAGQMAGGKNLASIFS
jgi:hypothetical protein